MAHASDFSDQFIRASQGVRSLHRLGEIFTPDFRIGQQKA
jgi:hypothetical protein